MARFDVYANPGARAAATPFLLDVQSDLLDSLDSRVVIPLCETSRRSASGSRQRWSSCFGGSDGRQTTRVSTQSQSIRLCNPI